MSFGMMTLLLFTLIHGLPVALLVLFVNSFSKREFKPILAGVDTDADVFFRTDTPSVTFTGNLPCQG